MARKENIVEIQDGLELKKFRIRQMAHTKLEAWIGQALFAIGGSELDPSIMEGGKDMAKAGMRMLSNVSYEKVKPLYDELLTCCAVLDGGVFVELHMGNADAYIDAMPTLFKLRMEAMKLNMDFFDFAGMLEKLKKSATETLANGSTLMPMSPA